MVDLRIPPDRAPEIRSGAGQDKGAGRGPETIYLCRRGREGRVAVAAARPGATTGRPAL